MYDYIKVMELLNKMEQLLLAQQASINAMKAIVEPESGWSQEEEDQYRMRHSS